MEKDVRLGDILIFEAGDDWVGRAIALLTQSSVSHSAMVFAQDQIVEMGSKGIGANRVAFGGDGRGAYLLRHRPIVAPEPLIAAAQRYLDQKMEYDFPALVLLAGLLIYRSVRPTPRWQRATDLIIDAACLALDKLLNLIIHKDTRQVMMCSQLVYQCYLDCGADYRISIPHGQTQDRVGNDASVVLAELAAQTNDALAPPIEAHAEVDEEALARELYEAIEEEKLANAMDISVDLSGTVSRAARFMDILERILEQLQLDIPLPSLFVTPADLHNNAENLENLGKVPVRRIR